MENDKPIVDQYKKPIAEWRYIELKGYMSAVMDLPQYGVKKGWTCTNCKSMVYYTKCPNDECYNFYMYTNFTSDNAMKELRWKMLQDLGIVDKEKDNA